MLKVKPWINRLVFKRIRRRKNKISLIRKKETILTYKYIRNYKSCNRNRKNNKIKVIIYDIR